MKNLFTLLTALLITTNAFGAQSAINYGNDGVTAVVASNDTDWAEYTATTQGIGNPTGAKYEWMRRGGSLYLRFTFTTGTVSASEVRVSFPSGVPNVASTVTSIQYAGLGFRETDASDSTLYCMNINGGENFVAFGRTGTAVSTNCFDRNTGSAAWGSSTKYSFVSGPIPIEGWVTGNAAIGPRSEVIVSDCNGAGSTNTKIGRFDHIQKNVGTAITYADSATFGASFTINENGIYSVTHNTNYTAGGANAGISVNTSAPTTAISFPITYAQGFRTMGSQSTNNTTSIGHWTGFLQAGDIVYAHHGTNVGNQNDEGCFFSIVKVSN